MTVSTGPQQVLDAARSAADVLRSALDAPLTAGTREEWAAALTGLRALASRVEAARDLALVRLAAIEAEVLDDGEVVERYHAPGHVALDAPSIASGALCVGAVHAERLVRDAVRRAADGPEGTSTCTGLGGLHEAMAAGRLDSYRASVVADELHEAPAEVAAAVVAALDPHLDHEDAGRLRRRTRRMLARVGPDLLRRRAVRARQESSLRRWVGEPGVDTWLGTFPSEEAASAWAAIDALAQQFVVDGTCATVERARARALTDLVTGNATIDLRVVLTTPAGGAAAAPSAPSAPGDLVEVAVSRTPHPVLVPREWLSRTVAGAVTDPALCQPSSGGLLDPDCALSTSAYRPGPRLAAFVRARDGRCRFPGCHVAARYWTSTTSAPRCPTAEPTHHHPTADDPPWPSPTAPTQPSSTTSNTHPGAESMSCARRCR